MNTQHLFALLILALAGMNTSQIAVRTALSQGSFDNADVSWELTPLGRLVPNISDSAYADFQVIAEDHEEVIRLLNDADRLFLCTRLFARHYSTAVIIS